MYIVPDALIEYTYNCIVCEVITGEKFCMLIVLVAKSTKSSAVCELTKLFQLKLLLPALLLKSTSCVFRYKRILNRVFSLLKKHL
jgi:hypothetical protein